MKKMKIYSPYKNKEKIITIKRNNEIVAYLSYKQIGKPKHELYEITRVEVDKKYRHTGLATKMFNHMIASIKFRKLFVTTHESNIKARKFYDKMGMIFETSLPNHYYQGEDEVIYSLYR